MDQPSQTPLQNRLGRAKGRLLLRKTGVPNNETPFMGVKENINDITI
jgi:hypothetical protein